MPLHCCTTGSAGYPMKKIEVLPPTYLLIALLLMAGLRLLLPVAVIFRPPWGLLGLVPLGLGVAMELIADQAFRNARTTVRPFEVSATLVKDGLYRWSRNPMYLGFLLILCGAGIMLGGASPFAAVVVFPILMERRFIRFEESVLAARFGDEWERYAATTRRWI